MVPTGLQEKRILTTKRKNYLWFWRSFSANDKKTLPNLSQKLHKLFHLWHIRADSPLLDKVNQKSFSIPILYVFSLQWSNMIFSVSNDGIESFLDFGSNSVSLILKNLVKNDKKSHEIPLAARNLLLSVRQDFFNKHLPRVPFTHNQEGTMEMRDEVLSSVGAQDMDTSGYQVSDLDDVEFYGANDQLHVDAVFRRSIDTPFSPSTFNNSEMGSMAQKRILVDEEQDKENSPPSSTHANSSVLETNRTSCVDEKLPLRNKNWECSRLYLYEFDWNFYIIVTVYVF